MSIFKPRTKPNKSNSSEPDQDVYLVYLDDSSSGETKIAAFLATKKPDMGGRFVKLEGIFSPTITRHNIIAEYRIWLKEAHPGLWMQLDLPPAKIHNIQNLSFNAEESRTHALSKIEKYNNLVSQIQTRLNHSLNS